MASSKLTKLEAQVTEALWTHGPLAVRDVVLKCVIAYATIALGESEAANAVEQALKATGAAGSSASGTDGPPPLLN